MDAQHPLSVSRSVPYLCDGTKGDITLEGGGDTYEEYAQLAKSFYRQLLDFNGFLLHSSAVEYDGRAIAFSAPSGTGKSTHSSYWRNELGAKIINDDKPAIRFIEGLPCVCGTPFSGKQALSRNVCVPLYAIVFLSRGSNTVVRRLSAEEALYRLLSQTLRPTEARQYDQLLNLLDRIIQAVPIYEAAVPNDPQSALEVKSAIVL